MLNTVLSLALVLGLGSAASAGPITLTPSDLIPADLGSTNCEPGCIYTAFSLTNDGSLGLLYKADVAGAADVGTYAASYDTVFSNTSTDPQDATISWLSGFPSIGCPACYLAVKDGNQNPSYYFYDLALWDGMDTIQLSGFWPNQGAISHVSIWGASSTPPPPVVPEPGSLALLGLGMAALAGHRLRRRRRS